jgi:hypothetical protein
MSGKAVKLPKALKNCGKQIVSSYGESFADHLLPFEFRLYESEEKK